MPCSYQTAEGFTDKKYFTLCCSALSRLQTPFDYPLCDAMIGTKLYHTWPTAITIRYSFCTFLTVKPPRHNVSFSHSKQHSISRIHQFCSSSCCIVISVVTVWISMCFSLNKIVVFNVFLLNKLKLQMVYVHPADAFLLVTMCEQCVPSSTVAVQTSLSQWGQQWLIIALWHHWLQQELK